MTENPENIIKLSEEILNGRVYKTSKLPLEQQTEPTNNMELKLCYQTDDAGETEVMLTNEKCLYKVPKYEGSTSNSSLSSQMSQINSPMAWMKVQKQTDSCGYPTTYFEQFSILLCRMLKQISRNRTGEFICYIFLSLLTFHAGLVTRASLLCKIVKRFIKKMDKIEPIKYTFNIHVYACCYSKLTLYILSRKMLYISGLWIQLFHHILCSVLIGLCFLNMANDGTQMFNHLKMCVGLVIFFAYTQIMVPVLVCKYQQHD